MEPTELLRVVALRKGKLNPAEFRLREGEQGLSLFAKVDQPSAAEVIDAVRAAGKQGDLAAAIIEVQEIRALGLNLVQTPGGTPVSKVNAIHWEARLPFLRQLLLWLRGRRPVEFFNDHFSRELYEIARLAE